jgi:hypothetical protein
MVDVKNNFGRAQVDSPAFSALDAAKPLAQPGWRNEKIQDSEIFVGGGE